MTHKRNTTQSDNWKELLKNADALYMKSQFEDALIQYHRAKRIHPHCSGIKLGILRCEESLNKYLKKRKSKYHPEMTKSEDPNDDPDRTMSFSEWASSLVTTYNASHSAYPTDEMKNDARHMRKLTETEDYLNTLMTEIEQKHSNGNRVREMISSEIKYIQHHFNFWKHQIPPDAACQLLPRKVAKIGKPMTRETTNLDHNVISKVLTVLQAFQVKDYRKVLQLGKPCIKLVESSNYLELDNKDEVSSNIHSTIGSAYFELAQYKDALEWHRKDLTLSRQRNLPSALSRALGNIGRVYAKTGKYTEAVKIWEEKVPMCRSDPERAWLHHELGYCYMAQDDGEKALYHANISHEAAIRMEKTIWLQNSLILAGQALVMLGKLHDALSKFHKALEILKIEDKTDKEDISALTIAMTNIQDILDESKMSQTNGMAITTEATGDLPHVIDKTGDTKDKSLNQIERHRSESNATPGKVSHQDQHRPVSVSTSMRSQTISGLGSSVSVKTISTERCRDKDPVLVKEVGRDNIVAAKIDQSDDSRDAVPQNEANLKSKSVMSCKNKSKGKPQSYGENTRSSAASKSKTKKH